MLAGCRELSACRPDPIMQRFDGASSLNGSEDRAPGGSVPRCRAVTPSLDSELMPEADPFDFVNTDCRLFFFFFSSFSNAGNTCSSRISPRMKYSFSCRLLPPDFVHAFIVTFSVIGVL